MQFRILVVEDHHPTREVIVRRLQLDCPERIVDEAGSVQEAVAAITKASEAGWHYDLAILDFKLPSERGANPEVDESVCHTIFQSSRETVITHITAYADDRAVLGHIRKYHSAGSGAAMCLVDKAEAFWIDAIAAQALRQQEELAAQARRQQANNAVDQTLYEISLQWRSVSNRRMGGRDLISEMNGAGLCHLHQAARAGWDDLDAERRRGAALFLDVSADGKKILGIKFEFASSDPAA